MWSVGGDSFAKLYADVVADMTYHVGPVALTFPHGSKPVIAQSDVGVVYCVPTQSVGTLNKHEKSRWM